MQLKNLFDKFNSLQNIYGDPNFDPVYGCGNIVNPRICFVFMNPTARNVSAYKTWTGIKAPWIGTKNVWNMFFQLGFLDEELIGQINNLKPTEWDYNFSEKLYKKISNYSLYITNLSKATQVDARALSNDVFRNYLDLFKTEIDMIKPSVIITFGNQVSSVLLNKSIKVSDYRKKHEILEVNGNHYKVFPVYYPVGQGMRNMAIAKEDIDWIVKNNI